MIFLIIVVALSGTLIPPPFGLSILVEKPSEEELGVGVGLAARAEELIKAAPKVKEAKVKATFCKNFFIKKPFLIFNHLLKD